MSRQGDIVLGFLPLMDSAILVAAHELGFAAKEGLQLTLMRETSWANIRDRLAVGHIQAAHMLAPMPIASNLNLSPLPVPIVAPMVMGLGGNAVTVSKRLHEDMLANGSFTLDDPASSGRALKAVLDARRAAGQPILKFAVVHPFSGHNYELRYWLSACGIKPDSEVEIVIVPPPFMADALASGVIDGYCVGEPWNTVAASNGSGRIVTVKAAIWKRSPEKVLGVQADWAAEEDDTLKALLRAMYRAAEWCDAPEHHDDLATILSSREYLGQPKDRILPALQGNIGVGDGRIEAVEDFFVPLRHHATFPWQGHALWFYEQMIRCGHVSATSENAEIARNSFRPDIYRRALEPLGVEVPLQDMMPVGGGFFDGVVFDPAAHVDA